MTEDQIETLKRMRMNSECVDQVLRHEMLRYIPTIQGYAAIMQKVDFEKTEGLPADFPLWVNKIFDNAKDLRMLLEILTGSVDQESQTSENNSTNS